MKSTNSPIQNKVIWITGGTSGIGLEISKLLDEIGAKVICSGTKEIDSYKEQFLKSIEYIKCDVSEKDQVNETVDQIISKHESIDILINNAGIFLNGKTLDLSIDDIDRTIQVNLLGSIYTTKICSDHMIKQKNGKIMNILSVASVKYFENSSVYSASKAGLLAFSESFRAETRNKGIDIINILPGATDTPAWEEQAKEWFIDPKDLANACVQNLELSYIGNMLVENVIIRPKLGDL